MLRSAASEYSGVLNEWRERVDWPTILLFQPARERGRSKIDHTLAKRLRAVRLSLVRELKADAAPPDRGYACRHAAAPRIRLPRRREARCYRRGRELRWAARTAWTAVRGVRRRYVASAGSAQVRPTTWDGRVCHPDAHHTRGCSEALSMPSDHPSDKRNALNAFCIQSYAETPVCDIRQLYCFMINSL